MDERFVGRKTELAALHAALKDGQSIVLIGGRRSGKTWLVGQIDATVIERPVFVVSGDKLDFEDEVKALKKIAKTFGVAWQSGWDAFDGREAIEERLAAIGACALVLDEADRILGRHWAGGFLAWLRSLIDTAGRGRTFAIVAAGGPMLDHYRNPHDLGSPVLNLATRLRLDPLDRAAIDDLVVGQENAPVAGDVWSAAGGQPVLAQLYLRRWLQSSAPTFDAVMQAIIEEARPYFAVWREQLGPDGQRFLRELPAVGVEHGNVYTDEGYLRARYLCLVLVDGERVLPGPQAIVSQVLGASRPRWDVAISYAGEDHKLAKTIATGLKARGIETFFAEDETAWVWGKDLSTLLPNLYGQDAGTVVVLCSALYRVKHWTRVEYDAVRAANDDRIVLVALDGKVPDDWPPGDLYLDGKPENLVALLDLITKRVRPETL